MRVAGGDPTYTILGHYASPEAQEALREKLGLNLPLHVQYFDYLRRLATFNLGDSLIHKVPIAGLIGYNLRFTLELSIAGFFVALLVGLPLGIIAGCNPNGKIDHVVRVISLVFPSMPPFYIGVIFILILGIMYPLFPPSGGGELGDFWGRMYRLILPAVSLGLFISGIISRITRASMLDTLKKDHVTVARAKGLSEYTTIMKHVFRNALIPIVTTAGMLLASTLAGTVMTESVFGRAGLGKLLVVSVNSRDYPVVETLLAIYSLIIAFSNLGVDLIYGFLDPRIKYD
jgi:ABC-type dipeptide/oligopeptide/nickel transport system permease component